MRLPFSPSNPLQRKKPKLAFLLLAFYTFFISLTSIPLSTPPVYFQSLTNAFSRNSRIFNYFQTPGVFFCLSTNSKIKILKIEDQNARTTYTQGTSSNIRTHNCPGTSTANLVGS